MNTLVAQLVRGFSLNRRVGIQVRSHHLFFADSRFPIYYNELSLEICRVFQACIVISWVSLRIHTGSEVMQVVIYECHGYQTHNWQRFVLPL